MNKTILATIATGAFALASGRADLVAHYTLDETSGDTVADSSSNGTVGTVVAGNIDVAGVANSAFRSTGGGGISTPDGSLGIAGNDARTISFWFNAVTVATQGRLVSMGDQEPAGDGGLARHGSGRR